MFKLFKQSLPFLLKSSPFLPRVPLPVLFHFSKVGKKKQEKIEKEKSKSQANLSSEIALTQIEGQMQKEVDLYKVLWGGKEWLVVYDCVFKRKIWAN